MKKSTIVILILCTVLFLAVPTRYSWQKQELIGVLVWNWIGEGFVIVFLVLWKSIWKIIFWLWQTAQDIFRGLWSVLEDILEWLMSGGEKVLFPLIKVLDGNIPWLFHNLIGKWMFGRDYMDSIWDLFVWFVLGFVIVFIGNWWGVRTKIIKKLEGGI